MQGVQNGMFCPMGDGDVPVAEVVTELERSGYDGWYVLEQARPSPTANRRRVKAPRSMFSGASNISVLSMRSSPQVRRPHERPCLVREQPKP